MVLTTFSPDGWLHSFKGLGIGKQTSQGDLKSLVCLMSCVFQIPFCFLQPLIHGLCPGLRITVGESREEGEQEGRGFWRRVILPVKSTEGLTERNSKNPGLHPGQKEL